MTTEVNEPKGAPLPHPPVGRQLRLLRIIFKEPSTVLDELRTDYGPICSLGAGPVRMAVIGGPREMRELYAIPTSSFRWNHKFNVLGFLIGCGPRPTTSSVRSGFQPRPMRKRWPDLKWPTAPCARPSACIRPEPSAHARPWST